MPLNYSTIPERDLGRGIDVHSSENQLQPGFSADILNGDVIERRVTKRKGYQGYAGNIPVRVSEIEYAGTSITFTLDGSIDLSEVRSSPIIVYGRSEGGRYPSTDGVAYYSEFTADPRVLLSAGSGTETIDSDSHGYLTNRFFVGTAVSTSLTDFSNEYVLLDGVRVDKTNADVDLDYDVYQDTNIFVYYADKTSATGVVYNSPNITTGTTGSSGGLTWVTVGDVTTFDIPATEHQLNNFQIITEVYEDTGTEFVKHIPEKVTIDTSGTVSVSLIVDTTDFDFTVILSSAPTANLETLSVAPGTTGSVTFATEGEFIFPAVYRELSVGGDLELVNPDDVVYSAADGEVTVTITNNSGDGYNFEIFYELGEIKVNEITVTDTISATYTDSTPQLTIWGLDHSEIYEESDERQGWANHIDSYRSVSEERLVTGLGGNLFAAQTYSEAATSYLYPALYPRLRDRLSNDVVVAPVFQDDTSPTARTRGYITASNTASGYGTITTAAYNSGTGYVDYTISLPSKALRTSTGAVETDINNIISSVANLEDYLTVSQMGHSRHNGTFKIKSVTDGTDQIIISVENSQITTVDYDEQDAGGQAGIFTDQIELLNTSEFLAGDRLVSDAFGGIFLIDVVSSVDVTVVISGVVSGLALAGGQRINGTRECCIIPLRDNIGTAEVPNYVRGDMVRYTGENRLFRVKSVNILDNTTVNIIGDGTTATATLASGNTNSLAIGRKYFISGGSFAGAATITSIPSTTTFTFSSTTSATDSGLLVGKTVEIDEIFTWTDPSDNATQLTVEERWIPIEAPQDKYQTHFDNTTYTNQDFIRSTMSADNLYLTNSSDEVMKYDGSNLYRAGFPRWQPSVFINVVDEGSGGISGDTNPFGYTAVTSPENSFTVTDVSTLGLQSGDRIQDADTSTIFTVNRTDESAQKIYVNEDVSGSGTGGTDLLRRAQTYRYYFRLNMVDRNNNIIAGASIGYEDNVIELFQLSNTSIKLSGFPKLDNYDYDRLELEIYRTSKNTVAPLYKVTTISIADDADYIIYKDTAPDEVIVSDANLDPVNSVLLGPELGTAWREPPRAKYVTSAGNKALYANLTDYQELDIRFIADPLATASNFNGEIYTFRKDNTNTSTVTDLENVARYELTTTSEVVASYSNNGGNLQITTTTGFNLAAGEWVYLHTSGTDLTYSGWFQVLANIDANNFTISEAYDASFSDTLNIVVATSHTDIPVYLEDDNNYGSFNGNSTSIINRVTRRLSNAINASMKQATSPWVLGNAGGEYAAGQLVVRRPRADVTITELELPASYYADIFVNNIKRSTSDSISAFQRSFPSRVVISYANFPEIFDNPTAASSVSSDSVVDVNSSDGQEITGMIPFFGESTSQDSRKESAVVIFKSNSIYMLNTDTRAVSKLETRGLGCTAPYSIAVTKNGVIFANESGIYRLNRSLEIIYVGERMERNWTDEVNQDQLALAQGHHYAIDRKYKLSVPTGTNTKNNEVYVYDHTREQAGQSGGWTRYDNHPATGWANLGQDAYYCSSNGRVFSIRRAGDVTDYRDDDSAVQFTFITRLMDFGDGARRKAVASIISHFRALATTTGTSLLSAVNSETDFSTTTAFKIQGPIADDNLSDTTSQAIISVRSSLQKRKCLYLQLKYVNITIDEPLEIAGFDVKVAGLNRFGITEAADTTQD